ncbi:PucR family transcriptional regulator [Lactiplantibacillus plajomi]|uniref:PucR family transcriptional regulator n=1 Tax=Lactiplantibacillus plajomi TaxID=1457217 RepID=A0ABV6K1N3_9LACO|nr:helix-turn-helix domain-containing protein [Lactiplantibacillus plajomi]
MKLSQLLTNLTASFAVTKTPAALTSDPTITRAVFACPSFDPQPHQLYLTTTDHHVRLSYWEHQYQAVATVNLGDHLATTIAVQNQLLKLLTTLGTLLNPAGQLQAVNTLAINAITADFDTTLAAAVSLLQNPMAIIDLNGQILSRSHTTDINGASIHAAVETNKIARWLLDHGFAPDNPNFLTQVYIAKDNLSAEPMLITPLANGQEPIGYLVMAALKTPLNDVHARLINPIGQVIAGSVVKNQIMPTTESQRDELLNMLLTERQSSTFAAQFAEQHAVLPTAMVLVRCNSLTDQAPMILQQRLQYLLTPHFKQVLVSVFRQQCFALISLSLADYNGDKFRRILSKVTRKADCRLIISQHYVNPEDTFAASLVCNRTARLQTLRGRVIFCEDQFFNLSLERVNHVEILPFFLNPALRELAAYDAQNNTALVKTLDGYLRATCNLTQSAKDLYVHPNTLRNRLKHITKLTGCDLHDAETCFKLASSFKLQRFLISHKYSTQAPIPAHDPLPAKTQGVADEFN